MSEKLLYTGDTVQNYPFARTVLRERARSLLMPEQDNQLDTALLRLEVTPTRVPEPLKLDDIREISVRAAILGRDIQDLQNGFERRLAFVVDTIDQHSTLYSKAILDEQLFINVRLREFEERRLQLAATLSGCQSRIDAHRRLEVECKSVIDGLLRKASQKQYDLRSRHADRMDRQRRESELSELAHRNAVATEKAKIAQQHLDANKAGIQRARELIEDHLADANRRLAEAHATSSTWNAKGLTWTVARFMSWASLVSLAGPASLLLPILSTALPQDTSTSSFPNGLRATLAAGGAASPFKELGKLVLFMGAIFAVFALFVVVAIFLIRLIHPEWGTHTRQSNSEDDRSAASELGNWLEFFQVAPRSVSRRLANITRKTYGQMIASTPILCAVVLLSFVWMLGTGPATPGSPSAKGAYMAVLFGLLILNAGVPFSILGIMPVIRSERVHKGLFIFYAAIFTAPLVAILVNALMPLRPGSGLGAALLTCSGLASLIGFGHGIFLQGIFLRESQLEKDQLFWQQALSQINHVPTAADYTPRQLTIIIETAQPEAPGKTGLEDQSLVLERLRAAVRAVSGWLTSQMKAEEDKNPSVESSAERDLLRKTVDQMYLPEDLVEPMNKAWTAYLLASNDRVSSQHELSDKDKSFRQLDENIQMLRTRLGSLERYKREIFDTHNVVALEMKVQHLDIQEAIKDAYALGRGEAAPEPQNAPALGLPSPKDL